jgi:F-type H+-transporting ATPase subunit delta
MLSALASRYSRALVDVVTAPGSGVEPARVLRELHAIEELVGGSPSLRVALLSPAVSPSRKRAVMARLLAPMGVHEKVRNFVWVVIDHRRVAELGMIIQGFETLLDQRLGFVRADVASAHELSADQRAALEAQVARLAGKKARLKYTTDPALIAGVVARVGSTVYDGSVRGQLEQLRMRLGRG